jgi:hypothetical protein
MSGSSSARSSSARTTRKRRCFLDAGTGRNPSKAMCSIWRQRLADELDFVAAVSELERSDLLVTENPSFWQDAPARIVDCKHMSQLLATKLGISYARTPSPEPEPSPPQKKQKKQKQQRQNAARVQTREYTHTLDELRQMVADVEAELATDLHADIQQHLHETPLSATTRGLLERAAVHGLGHRTSAARVVGEREAAATAAAAAPVLYVTLAGVALPALPALP